jgi:RNA polymerase sigma-70 factor (ECF subfamily)
MAQDDTTTRAGAATPFENTHWTAVMLAAQRDMPGADDALDALCRKYWPPIYAFLRRQGHNPEDAKDLTQGFFAQLLRGHGLDSVHPSFGRFRTFLLACLKNHVRNELDKQRTQKRGAGQVIVPLSSLTSEVAARFEPRVTDDPLTAFQRQWAVTLITEVLGRLKARSAEQGKGELFECLSPFLTDEADRGDYATVAVRVNMSEGALRTAATRLRGEFRKLLLEEVRRTVHNDEEVEDEIRHLFCALSSSIQT